MTEDTNTEKINLLEKQKNKEEMKKQVVSFALMIFLTLTAFAVVAFADVPKMYAIPVLIIMAIIQVVFQFYFFMHLKEKDHEMPMVLMYGGVWAALLTLASLGLIVWW